MVIYDGIHYDALALAPSPDAPESADQTVFNHSRLGPEKLAAIEASALELTRQANKVSLPPLARGRAETGRLLTGPLAPTILCARSRCQQHKFTDLAKFSLRCSICRKGLVGQREAQAHAIATGHGEFEEYL